MDEQPNSRLPLARPEELARDLVAARSHDPRIALGPGIIRRLDTSGAPGLGAAAFSRRFVQRTLRLGELELTVSPYAPPQRQISVVRQGAPMWAPSSASAPEPAPGFPQAPAPAAQPAAPPRAVAQDANQLPPDLKALLELHRSRGTI
jgi:hypothetical protein